MTTVAVTGSSGKLGRHVVRDLHDHGYRVLALDRVPDPGSLADASVRVEFTDYGQVIEAFTAVDDRHNGVDAVVHLAAIPAPGLVTNAVTFANNITATYNVFAAARSAGIRNVVWASSETVLGLPFDVSPPYIPVDEDYPVRPESTYSLVKSLEEEMARHFCRWNPELKMIGLRFSNVMDQEDYERFPSFDTDPRLRRWNLWAYIDGRDGAQAVRRALAHDSTGADVFVIANADTVIARRSVDLAAEVYPDVPVTRELGEHETMLSIDKARRVLGYEPEFSWRTDDAGQPTDRSYWTDKGSPATVALADEMLGIANEVTGRGLSLKYNKSYIGLAKDGIPVNFFVLIPRKRQVSAEFKLKQTDEVSALVESAGIEDHYYTARNGQLVISLENEAAVAKHRALITDLIRRASGTPAPTED